MKMMENRRKEREGKASGGKKCNFAECRVQRKPARMVRPCAVGDVGMLECRVAQPSFLFYFAGKVTTLQH